MKLIKIIVIIFLCTLNLSAQENTREQSLLSLIETKKNLKDELSTKESELSTVQNRSRYEELSDDIRNIKSKIHEVSDSFIAIAANSDIKEIISSSEKNKFSFQDELSQMAQPLILELKKITQTPREINSYENQIDALSTQINLITTLINDLEKSHSKNQQINDEINTYILEWQVKKDNLASSKKIIQEKLNLKLENRKSFRESVTNLFQIFFESRARNLFIAITSTIIFWLLITQLHKYIRRSLIHDKEQQIISHRVLTLVFILLTYLGSAIIFLFCLFIFNDWLLLILGTLIIVGLAWTSRYAIPRFWYQGGLLLNFGPVREGEKIIYSGMPMLVESLRLYVTIANPHITDSKILLPLSDLVEYRSRKVDKNEIWFPTKVNDWVILTDGTYGQIESQTMENICVRLLGNSRKYYPTLKFVELNPEVISNGFRINTTLGIDYDHQARVLDEIIEIFKNEFSTYLPKDIQSELLNLRIEFKIPNSSSLDFEIITDFSGNLAHRYNEIKRSIQADLFRICVNHNLTIPFQQMEVHVKNIAQI